MARNDSIAKMKIETTLSPGFGQSHSNAGPHHHVCQVREPIMVLHCKPYVSKVFSSSNVYSRKSKWKISSIEREIHDTNLWNIWFIILYDNLILDLQSQNCKQNVQCEQRPSSHKLHQDGRRLACLQPLHPLLRSALAHIQGDFWTRQLHNGVTIFTG